MEIFSTQFLPCLLCGNKLQKRTDKHSKPYFVCNPCGIQFFVRRKQGIERLDELLRASERHAIPFQQADDRIYKLQALLTEIDETKKQINRLNDEIGFFFRDEDKMRARDALMTRLDGLLEKFESMCKKSVQT
jgi:hypothetical protein